MYASTLKGHRKLDTVPDAVQALLDRAAEPEAIDPGEVTTSDQEAINVLRGNHDFLVWTVDLGHGTIELRTRKRTPSEASVYQAAWGSWELGSFLLDSRRSQILIAADTGITLLDLATHGERRIAGTARGDLPYALSADQNLFVWSTRNHCGDEFLADDNAPQRFCLAYLKTSKARQ